MYSRLRIVAEDPSAATLQPPLDGVIEALSRLRYGTIQITVHDGRLVQLDITERRRFP